MTATISVIVPIYNGEAFVAGCWSSIVRQAQRPLEVVFIDDGSTDGTARALAELRAPFVRTTVLETCRVGPAASRNAGIRAARGEFVAFLDVDDAWPETKLAQAVETFAREPDLQVVGGLVQLFAFERGGTMTALGAPQRRVNLGAYVFRRDVFERVGPLDPSLTFAEDVDLMCRLREANVPLRELDVVTLFYRRHPGNMTRGRDAKELGLFAALSKSLGRARAGSSG